MQITDVMRRDVEFVSPGASVREAAEMMGELAVGALPVGTPDAVEGVITGRDILFRAVAAGRDPGTTRVAEVMSSTVFSCREQDSIDTALDLMAQHDVRRLPVTDAAGRVCGWLTLEDVARRMLEENPDLVRRAAG